MSRRTTAQQRARLVARYRRSGLTQREFAEREGITVSALQGWLYRRGKKVEPEPHFVEVVSSPGPEPAIEITVGDVALRLPANFEPAQIAAIVSALARREPQA